jgi:hypothetical protein
VWQSVKEPLQEVHFLFLNTPKVLAFAAPSAKLLIDPIRCEYIAAFKALQLSLSCLHRIASSYFLAFT